MIGGPVDVVVGKRRHEVVAVIVVWLHAQLHAVALARALGGLDKVFRQQLLLLVEIVAGALVAKGVSAKLYSGGCAGGKERREDELGRKESSSSRERRAGPRTTSMSSSSLPFHALTSSVASWAAHASLLSSPK